MCRAYHVNFESCEHAGPEHTETFKCKRHPYCGPTNVIDHTEDGFCPQCLADLAPNAPFHRLNYIRRNRIKQLLDLAPDIQYRFFLDDVPGVTGYMYDNQNLEEFTGRLDETDGRWLGFLVRSISSYIMDPELPELSSEQWYLFEQIRIASVAFNILEIESHRTHVERTTDPKDLLRPAGPWLRMLKGFYNLETEDDSVQAAPPPSLRSEPIDSGGSLV